MSENKLIESAYVRWYINRVAEPNLAFANWMTKVEFKLKLKYGFNLLDLPNEDYMIYFESSYSPDMMVQVISESNGF